MAKTKARLFKVNPLNLFVLEKVQEVFSEPPNQLQYNSRSRGKDLECLVDGSCQLIFTDPQLSLGLFLEREALRQEVDEYGGGLATDCFVDDFEGHC